MNKKYKFSALWFIKSCSNCVREIKSIIRFCLTYFTCKKDRFTDNINSSMPITPMVY